MTKNIIQINTKRNGYKNIFILKKISYFIFIISIFTCINTLELFSFTKAIRFGSNNNTLDSLVITWHSNSSGDHIKWGYTQDYEYGTFTGDSRTYNESDFLVDYKFPLLNEKSNIYYKIQNDEIWGEELTFETSTSPDSLNFSFTFGGDSRDSLHHWQLISDAIEKTDFSFNLGDMIDDADIYEEWEGYFEFGSSFITSNLIYTVFGNHEVGDLGLYETLFNYPNNSQGVRYYSFEYNNTGFIILDSEEPSDPEQLIWLEAELYKFRNKMWKIVAFHRPFYTTGRHAGEMDDYFDTWWQKFDDYGVDFLLTSHTHNYMRSVPIRKDTLILDNYGNNSQDGICQIVLGGYGAPLYSSSVAIFVEESESVLHYGKITIDDMQLFFEAKDPNNFVFDTLRVDKRLIINEINYNSSELADSKDWIELFNPRENEIDLSNYVFKDENNSNQFLVPENTILPSKGYLVIAKDIADFDDIYPDVNNVIGGFDFGLSNTGELIRMYDSRGLLLDSVFYSSESPWPIEANGGGHSIELINWKNNNNVYSSWEASIGTGTPGRINSSFQVLNPIVINEINYKSSDTFDPDDWIELYNPNDFTMDISNYKLMDINSVPFFLIPEGTLLEKGEYLVICKSTDDFTTLFPDVDNFIGDLGFGLSGQGEPIRLYNTINVLVDTVRYDEQYPWPTAPNGTGPTLELIDPNYNNILPESWGPSTASHGTPGYANSVDIENNYELQITNYELKQNYPNPFNPITKINYELRITNYELAEITVHNSAGQIVGVYPCCRPASATNNHGSIQFDGSKFNSGVYYYSLVVDGKKLNTKAMLLIK